jgi:hypothetical protein
MKAKANYNPVTQSAGGEYEYTASDHRESRKDTLFSGAIVLVILAVIAAIIWYFLKGTSTIAQTIANPVKTVTDGVNKVIVDAGNWSFNAAVNTAKEIPGQVVDDTTLDAGDPIGDWFKITTKPVLTAGNTLITPIGALVDTLQKPPTMNGDEFADYFGQNGGIAGQIFEYGYNQLSAVKASNSNLMDYWPKW